MNVRERLSNFITGGPQVEAARATITALSAKEGLNNRKSRQLTEARRVTRRHLLKLCVTGASALAGSAALIRLGENVLTPEVGINWENITPQEKLINLEAGNYPDIPEFNPQNELFTATAEYFCAKVDCKFTPEELVSRVKLVDFNGLLKAYEQRNINLSDSEKEQLKITGLENTFNDNTAYINIDLLEEQLSDAQKIHYDSPQQEAEFKKRDLRAMLIRSVLLHTFSHINDVTNSLTFDPFTIGSEDGSSKLFFGEMRGFTFIGGESIDKKDRMFLGTNEAVTELSAIIIADGLKGYMSGNSRYNEAAFMIKDINVLTGVSDGEFLEMVQGNGSSEDLIKRWAAYKNPDNPNIQDGILALAAIGAYVKFGGNPEEYFNAALKYITGN